MLDTIELIWLGLASTSQIQNYIFFGTSNLTAVFEFRPTSKNPLKFNIKSIDFIRFVQIENLIPKVYVELYKHGTVGTQLSSSFIHYLWDCLFVVVCLHVKPNIVMPYLGAGTRSRIQARLSGMNIYHARTSKLVSVFLYLKRSLVHNSAHAAHVPARLQASWARVWTKDRSRYKKSETSFEVLA